MRFKKKASEIVPGDRIYLDTNPNAPREVTASYSLGARWGLEIVNLSQILQVDPEAELPVWSQGG